MKMLATGIDSLTLSVEVFWTDKEFFETLRSLKDKAKAEGKPYPGSIQYRGSENWLFNMEPYGLRGHEWVMRSKDFTLRVGDFVEQKQLPSVMVDYSSESLWRVGAIPLWEIVRDLIEVNGGQIRSVKVSRADLCPDLTFPEDEWTADKLKSHRVTRAKSVSAFWGEKDRLETLYIGQGDMQARLYDKVREIEKISHKAWMFDIWKIDVPPDDHLIIRVEFQMRREVLKEMGVGSLEEFIGQIESVWSYCTEKWLQFKDGDRDIRPELRNTLPWWTELQSHFLGLQAGEPVVRKKALRMDEEMLRKETMGFLSSLTAVKMEKRGSGALDFEAIEKARKVVLASLHVGGITLREFQERVLRKRAMYRRGFRG